MSHFTDSLYKLSLKFIAKHIDVLESFVGFPSLIAEDIFNAFSLEYTGERDVPVLNVLTKFVEVYENLVLERLNLYGGLLILNEHLENVVVLSRFVSELCVCCCSLGENHELLSHISEFKRLKKLCMKDNCMNDRSMRVLTLRMRLYKTGGKEIEHLNIAGNNFTDTIIPWLSAFPSLQYLDISGSMITEKGIKTLVDKCQLRKVLERSRHTGVRTEGWAFTIVEKWRQKEFESRVGRSELLVFYKASLIEKMKSMLPRHYSSPYSTSFIFRKAPMSECLGETSVPAVRKRKHSTDCDQKKIEEDLFDQYKQI